MGYLVLSRSIGDDVTLTIPPSTEERTITVKLIRVSTQRTARIGFQADRDVVILRSEVMEDSTGRKEGCPCL